MCVCVQELVVHPFWQVQLAWLDMPPEPQLEQWIRQNKLEITAADPRQSMVASQLAVGHDTHTERERGAYTHRQAEAHARQSMVAS